MSNEPSNGSSRSQRLLVVEDQPALRRALERSLAAEGWAVRSCATVQDAVSELRSWHPEAMVLDFALPDGDAIDILEEANSRHPTPMVVAISGQAVPEQSFRLAQLGVRRFLSKPVELVDLLAALEGAARQAPELGPQLRASVGRRPMQEVERDVRREMVGEAMARAGNSRSRAARLLAVSRQLLQHILRGLRQ